MRSFLLWLSEHRSINLIFCIGYYLLVVLPHEWMGKWIYSHFFFGDIDQYNLRFLSLITLASFIFFLPLFRNLKKESPSRTTTLGYLLFTLFLMVIAYFTIFVLATELVHFPQYAIMAIFLFPLSWRYTDTLFWATLLGALDEAYQYFYLAPLRTDYYDFNDVIINFLGAALGLVFVRSFTPSFPVANTRPFWQSPALWMGAGLLVSITLLISLDWIGIYPSAEENYPLLLLMRKVPESFWSKFHHIQFHIVLPGEGLLLLIGLFMVYSGLGSPRGNHQIASTSGTRNG